MGHSRAHSMGHSRAQQSTLHGGQQGTLHGGHQGTLHAQLGKLMGAQPVLDQSCISELFGTRLSV